MLINDEPTPIEQEDKTDDKLGDEILTSEELVDKEVKPRKKVRERKKRIKGISPILCKLQNDIFIIYHLGGLVQTLHKIWDSLDMTAPKPYWAVPALKKLNILS